MKIKLVVELDYDDETIHGDDCEAMDWFFETLRTDELTLHSQEIGDTVGKITVLNIETMQPA